MLEETTITVRAFATHTVMVLAGICLAGACCVSSVAFGAACPNEQFRIGPSSALPDCRAYEMVSPPDKNGGEVDGGVHKGAIIAPMQAAGDGESVTYPSTSAFIGAGAESAVVVSQYLSTRAANGWQTRAIVPSQELPKGEAVLLGEDNPEFSMYQGFNEGLSDGFLLAWNPQPDPNAPSGYFNPYLLETGSSAFQLLSEATPPVQPSGYGDFNEEGFAALYGGMSTDGQHVIFEANDALTPEAVPGRVNLYEWNAGRGLELVSVLPEGTVDHSGGPYDVDNNSMSFGQPSGGWAMPNVERALSSNGLRSFWNGGGSTNSQLYMHEITGSGAHTVEVSASQNPAVASGSAQAVYWTASTDGSRVYFTSTAKLTEDSTASGGNSDLYEYNTNTGVLSDLSVDTNTGETAGVMGVAGEGESEGSPYVYFMAKGLLADGATAGANNIYLTRGSGSEPAFIGSLGAYAGEGLDFSLIDTGRTSRVSPDGKLFVFQSARPLTGYVNIPANGKPCPETKYEAGTIPELSYYQPPEGRCTEVFEYDARSSKLTCVSCNPTGQPPIANSMVPEGLRVWTNSVGWQSPTVQQRYLLDDGRVFFQSEDALLPEATNGKRNVYEYEPKGVAQCAATSQDGCLRLISTGGSAGDSYFVDASSDGRDVFLLTSQQLVPQDGDGATDVYDAREDGGFFASSPPPCAGESCKPAIAPAPAIYGAPSSATFQGIENAVTPPPASTSKSKTAPKKKHKPHKQAHHRAKASKRHGVSKASHKRTRRGSR